MNIGWETIVDERYSLTKRLRVFGGWMVVHREMFDDSSGEAVTSVFVPDVDARWKPEIL